MYGAVNARLFDSAVKSDPDKVYEKIKDKADPGFCDYSFIGIQEAAGHALRQGTARRPAVNGARRAAGAGRAE